MSSVVETVLERARDKGRNDKRSRVVSLVASSPTSRAARLIWSQLENFADAGIEVRVVFARISTRPADVAAFKRFSLVFGQQAAYERIRIAPSSFRDQLEESFVLGVSAYWEGASVNALFPSAPKDGTIESFDDLDNEEIEAHEVGFLSAYSASSPLRPRKAS